MGALFPGPSSTGKTIAARISAEHLKLAFHRIDVSAVVSKYIGETEKNLSRVFKDAQDSNAIFFFDEADALFDKRSEVEDAHDRYANIKIPCTLRRVEDDRELAILTSNIRPLFDQAFLRRLSFQVEFLLTDAQHRQRVWWKTSPRHNVMAILFGEPLDQRTSSGLQIQLQRYKKAKHRVSDFAINFKCEGREG